MIYIICNEVYFNDSKHSLWRDDNPEDIVTLTVIPNRLLCYLLEHKGEIISRELILTAVWELYGLEPSGHSLNQNISILRKALSSLGLVDVIVTQPRVGIYIGSEIISILDENLVKNTPADVNSVIKSSFKPKEKPLSQYAIAIVLSIIMVLLVKFSFFPKGFDGEFKTDVMVKLGDVNECGIYTVTSDSDFLNKKILHISKTIIEEKKLLCLPDSDYIAYVDKSYLLRDKGRFVLGRCIKDVNSKNYYSSCEVENLYEK